MDVAWVALSLQQRIGWQTLQALLQHFNDDLNAALNADTAALCAVRGIGKKIAATIQQIDLEQVEQQMRRWQSSGVTIITRRDAHYYPALLRQIGYDEPPTLFVLGQLGTLQKTAAIVGTRQPTPQARQIAYQLGGKLAQRGYTIISGLALGIDAAAHEGALGVTNGRTLAVLGSGVLNVYPDVNRALAAKIQANGALISEVAPDATVNSPRLVSRNRIISGLSQHVIIVQSEADGGAMYAARHALAQKRTLYALDLPHSGNRQLIAAGAIALSPTLANLDLD